MFFRYDDADIEEELYVEEDEPFGAEMPLPVPPRPRNEEETCEGAGDTTTGMAFLKGPFYS